MLTTILLIVATILFTTMWMTYKPQGKYKNGMLFAVKLPAEAMEHERIKAIQTRFNRGMKRFGIAAALCLIPFLLLYRLEAYEVIYFFVWITGIAVFSMTPFRRAFRDTLALKREQGWFAQDKRVLQTDLRAAHLKNRRSAPVWLFAIPLAMGIALAMFTPHESQELIGLPLSGIGMTILFLIMSLLMRKTRAKVYSEHSEVNVALNQALRRSLSYLWLNVSIVENIHFGLIYILIINDNVSLDGVWLTAVLLFTAVPIAIIITVYRKINKLEKEVLEQDGKVIYTDDDEYWASGFSYHNPYDKSIMVTKRVGVGETVNTATWAGKLIMWGSLGLAAALMIGVSFMILRAEYTSPKLTLTANHEAAIDYPMYSYTFDLADIQELKLMNEVPKGNKTNGEATSKYARGKFRLQGLGAGRLYVFHDHPPYIWIKLKDGFILYNDQDPAKTKQLFEQLQQRIQVK